MAVVVGRGSAKPYPTNCIEDMRFSESSNRVDASLRHGMRMRNSCPPHAWPIAIHACRRQHATYGSHTVEPEMFKMSGHDGRA